MTPSAESPRRRSAGIVLFRGAGAGLEVLLVHPGGPVWASRDQGAWSIPKGEFEPGEEPLTAALREFAEELGSDVPAGELVALGEVRQKSGKLVHAWALAGDLDAETIVSNTFTMEWPPRSGRTPGLPRGRPRGVVRSRGRPGEDQPCADRAAGPPRRVLAMSSDSVSPTAHYTGYVWARNGLSHPALQTVQGRLLFESLHPLMVVSAALGRPSLERYLLARHRAIDALLARAIERDGVTPGARDRGRTIAARMALCAALRRQDHLSRGRPARDGRPQARGAGADRVVGRSPSGARSRCPARRRPAQPRGADGGAGFKVGAGRGDRGVARVPPRQAR